VSLHKVTFAVTASLMLVAGMLFGANIASADSIQVQGYQRASQTEACVAQVGETPWQASWGPDATWKPGWEQWANKGAGGWVCTRSITWAKTPVPASIGGVASAAFTCSIAGVRSPGGGACEVGDAGPGGGIIFYIDLSRATGSQFWEVGTDLGSAEWGCAGTDTGATGTAIGTGATNTAAVKTTCADLGIAARVASATAGGFSDWFLPSKDELNQLCKFARTQSTAAADQTVACNSGGTPRAGVTSGNYVSSTQFINNTNFNWVWIQGFDIGSQLAGSKISMLRVRAVRAF
jgi:hypothetical protein